MNSPDITRQPPATPDAERWIDDHGDALFAFAMQRVRDIDVAADLVQEAFVGALRASFEGRSTERTWLIGILKNKIVDHLRRRARRDDEATNLDRLQDTLFDHRGHWIGKTPSAFALPKDPVEQQELRGTLQQCMHKLPRRVAEVFSLREIDHHSAVEVAEILGISSDSVWTAMHRARLLLRECLQHNWFGEPRRGA
jgi:RNA polymerase sigma-70 factor (ECF subfamily)